MVLVGKKRYSFYMLKITQEDTETGYRSCLEGEKDTKGEIFLVKK